MAQVSLWWTGKFTSIRRIFSAYRRDYIFRSLEVFLRLQYTAWKMTGVNISIASPPFAPAPCSLFLTTVVCLWKNAGKFHSYWTKIYQMKADFICQQTIVNKYEHLFCLLCLWILIELCWLEASLIVPDFTFAVYGSSCNFVVSFSLLFFLYLFHCIPSCRGEAIKKNYF